MLELGDESLREPVRIASMALGLGLDQVCFVGAEFARALETMQLPPDTGCMAFETSDALREWLADGNIQGHVVLIKGSRGTRMEKTTDAL